MQWEDLAALNDEALVLTLRERGWSPELLRAVVRANLDLRFAPRRLALLRQRRGEFWKGGNGGYFLGNLDAASRSELRKVYREQHDLQRALLGEEAENPLHQTYQNDRYGPIAPEKRKLLQNVESDYGELIAQVREESMGVLLPEDQELIRLLEAERDRDVAELLTAEEQAEYELRASQTAFQLRFRLAGFEPTEQEYLAIFPLQKAFDERYGGSNPTAEQQRQKQQAQEELNQQIAAVLGEKRFEDFQLTTHHTWQPTAAWVEQQKLSTGTTRTLTALTIEMEKQLRDMRQNTNLSREERETRQATLYRDATLRLSQILPPHLISTYQSGPGRWLRSLQPRQH